MSNAAPVNSTDMKRSDLDALRNIIEAAGHFVLGKSDRIQLALAGLLAEGHLLIEDVPGVGKTTLAKVLARLMDFDFTRIQFTNDLLPADVLGTAIFDDDNRNFQFYKGPIFHQFVLADELNRATPKTQSAFLQVMEEKQVTVEGTTFELPSPFILMATQNPRSQIGTFPIPESQLDRFIMRLDLGFPDRESEKKILAKNLGHADIDHVQPVSSPTDFLRFQELAAGTTVSDTLLGYVVDLLDLSRSQTGLFQPLSPRAGLDLVAAAKSWAFLEGRDFVLPEDIQAVAVAVLNHRICDTHTSKDSSAREVVLNLIRSVRLT